MFENWLWRHVTKYSSGSSLPPYTPPCSRLVYSWEEWLCLPCQSSSPSNSTARGGRSSSSGPTADGGHCKSSAGGTVYICMRHAPVTGLPACVHVCTKERVSCVIYWNSDCDGRAMRPPVHLHRCSLCGQCWATYHYRHWLSHKELSFNSNSPSTQ